MDNSKAAAPPKSADQNERKQAAPCVFTEPDQADLEKLREHLDAQADLAEAIKEQADEVIEGLREILGAIDDEAYARAQELNSFGAADELDSNSGALRDGVDTLYGLIEDLPARGPGDPAEDDNE